MGSKKPFLVALLVHALSSGMILLSKAVFNMGMNISVFVFYRQVAGTIFMVPFAMVFEGITLTLNIYGVALIYTSASLGAATINCIPVITFAFAVLLRQVSLASFLFTTYGIVACMAGVVTLAFYKGPALKPPFHLHNFRPHSGAQDGDHDHASSAKNWIIGCFLLLASCICWALWLVLQCGQSFIVAIALERDPRQWKLGWNFRLLAVVYCGIFVTGVAYYLQSWVIAKKGPVFHAVMIPSNLIMTSLGSVFLLGETINLGS
ncbi:hypothetical protein Golob_021593 [Gossypium lobatum]|uniref:WAT1-related protein n=1 Tax=Gossypium lobatum TaxID=34289 RepID=A0A7J8LDZ8_9ROSI|nr:hypothetical protein [Gossypium lobatum]